MPFDQSVITRVDPPFWDGATLHLAWTSSAPAGTTFQAYVGGVLTWSGTSRWVSLTMPRSRVRIDVGAVGAGEGSIDFASALPDAPKDRAALSWLGGSYLDPTGRDDVQGFRVYGEPAPGAGIDYNSPLADLPAYSGPTPADGFGLGGFGQGGFGRSAASYRWTSEALSSGAWSFAVASYDAAGNQGTPWIASVNVQAPPRPPAPRPEGGRLAYAYDTPSRTVTLAWNPSPDAS